MPSASLRIWRNQPCIFISRSDAQTLSRSGFWNPDKTKTTPLNITLLSCEPALLFDLAGALGFGLDCGTTGTAAFGAGGDATASFGGEFLGIATWGFCLFTPEFAAPVTGLLSLGTGAADGLE